MSFEARYLHGNPVMVDYTPSGVDVAAGEVVITNDTARVAHNAIADGELGALAASGGVYEVTSLDAGGILADETVWWDGANNGVTTDPTAGGAPFGITVTAAPAGSGQKCNVRHCPEALTT